MTLDPNTIQTMLCERLCQDVTVVKRFDGALMVRTHFQFPDGDRYPIHLSALDSGAFRLSDRGHTLMHISYDHDVDSFMDGTRGMLMERIMAESGLQWDGGAFCFDTSPEKLSEAVFVFGQALTRIYDLTLLARSSVGSTFYDDLADALNALVDESQIHKDYQPPVPNATAYPVDYMIHGNNEKEVFLYGVPNRDKARLTTIMLSHFHRHELLFDSIIVFENQTEIPRLDLARLTDVSGDMVSSLSAEADLMRKLHQRTAVHEVRSSR